MIDPIAFLLKSSTVMLAATVAISLISACQHSQESTTSANEPIGACASQVGVSTCPELTGSSLDARCAVAFAQSHAVLYTYGVWGDACSDPPSPAAFLGSVTCNGEPVESWCVR